jgi:hypothetical protein
MVEVLVKFIDTVLHQLDQKIIYPHYDFKHLAEKYFEIGMKLRNDENIISIFLLPILSLMVIWRNGIIEPFPK